MKKTVHAPVHEITPRRIRMRRGRCHMTLEGWADVEGAPRKLFVALEFKVDAVRATVRPVEDPDDPCGPADPD